MAPKRPRILLFIGIGIGLSLLMAGLKAAIAWLAEVYVYAVPWVGGFLRSIELVEISNWLVFALLSVGIGAATFLLPRRWNQWARVALLIGVSPFVFSASYLMQQHLWIQKVATSANISYREARQLTHEYLTQKAGHGGFFGFYSFSTEMAELPIRREELTSTTSGNAARALSEELSSYNDPRASFLAFILERVGWLIRFMYMLLAGLTALTYYFKGHRWAEQKRQANAPRPPRVVMPNSQSQGRAAGATEQPPKNRPHKP
ncbi:MAG: hypothetical protein HC800_21160 [Phormidesmis sp. RL_2_1]|nr:hypothetical protein [Phormidesmis sp. RL_2_1]